jgi:hypothetical protein
MKKKKALDYYEVTCNRTTAKKKSAWTKRTPTKEGWFWWRENMIRYPVALYLKETQSGKLVIQDNITTVFVAGFKKHYPDQLWQPIERWND